MRLELAAGWFGCRSGRQKILNVRLGRGWMGLDGAETVSHPVASSASWRSGLLPHCPLAPPSSQRRVIPERHAHAHSPPKPTAVHPGRHRQATCEPFLVTYFIQKPLQTPRNCFGLYYFERGNLHIRYTLQSPTLDVSDAVLLTNQYQGGPKAGRERPAPLSFGDPSLHTFNPCALVSYTFHPACVRIRVT